MNAFKFDPADAPDQNVEKFVDHLKKHDPEMANILLKNLSHINPLPDGAQRTAARMPIKSFSEICRGSHLTQNQSRRRFVMP